MTRPLLCCVAFLLLSSCIKINGDFKGLYSYYNKTNRDYPGLIIRLPEGTSLCTLRKIESPHVIVVNGKDIKACMQGYENALLYIWSPKCRSKYCYPPTIIQRACKERGIELFVAVEYYDGASMSRDNGLDRQLCGIDTDYYHTSLTDKYIPKFVAEITGTPERNMKFIQFKDGHFDRTFLNIKDL